MLNYEDYLRELELLDTFKQLGRATGSESAVALPTLPPIMPPAAASARASTSSRAPVQAAKMAVAPIAQNPARAAQIATMDWAALAGAASDCAACGLCKQRKQALLGEGASTAPWLFVAEAPSEDDDVDARLFAGTTGKLLDAMFASAGLQRGREVYVTSVVKCRPPGSRTPTVHEAAACAPLLDRQIDLIQPKLIVALGKTAVMRLTGRDETMLAMRGKVHQYRGINVIAMYHPAYLLRSLTEKLKAWEDLVFAKQEMAKLP